MREVGVLGPVSYAAGVRAPVIGMWCVSFELCRLIRIRPFEGLRATGGAQVSHDRACMWGCREFWMHRELSVVL
ncbi:hypothetical protein SCP_0200400 [Sparassis crispa]|uniref:Uncharacterized protein n=1 Tax=Sparassis crispa TaxID=139825 RepID=A0A401G9N1_9APHY|nr:hypothetical protein SCP_0200400 [Sparassis crispa]GBE78843.1 hypothetical protein SCP_0200400 [Sparassis crispa]